MESYREQFSSRQAAKNYAEEQYAPDSYDALIWKVEQEQLCSVIARFVADPADVDYLDFASGTGRILGFLAPMFGSSKGIEISPSMAAMSRLSAPTATVECVDITDGSRAWLKTFGFISAFRFVLNAEGDLRRSALLELRKALHEPDGILVVNNHGNLLSHKLLFWPIHSARGFGRGHRTSGNYLRHGKLVQLFSEFGLDVRARYGTGLLGGRLASRLPAEKVERWERLLAKSPFSRFGSNQMYVLGARPSHSAKAYSHPGVDLSRALRRRRARTS